MRTALKAEMKQQVAATAKWMERTFNVSHDVVEVKYLSKNTGAAIIENRSSNRQTVWFYYRCLTIKGRYEWRSFMATYDHVAGLHGLHCLFMKVEDHNP